MVGDLKLVSIITLISLHSLSTGPTGWEKRIIFFAHLLGQCGNEGRGGSFYQCQVLISNNCDIARGYRNREKI